MAPAAPIAPTSDAQRQLVVASLMRYAPETVPLRQRVVDRLVLSGLLGSTRDTPFTVGTIIKNIFAGSNSATLRVERVQESVERLRSGGKIDATELRKKHAYFLTVAGDQETQRIVATTEEDIFEPSLHRLLQDISHICPIEVATNVCRSFLFECFGRFGVQMAKMVTGQLQAEDLVRIVDVGAAFQAACQEQNVSGEAQESLSVRCIDLLRSNHPDDVRLKFLITQGYFFAQLCEFGWHGFNPLIRESFTGCVFYLDTNVLITAAVSETRRQAFSELVQVAAELGVELRVSRATLTETLGVLTNHRSDMEKVIASVPEELVRRASDEIADEFLSARDRNAHLTVDEFFDERLRLFRDPPIEWNLTVDDRDEDTMLGGRSFPEAETVIQQEAVRSRGWEKPAATLRHDLAHYALILDERKLHAKTWFLTRDRGLPVAATRLAKGDLPFTFEFSGFLETASPFVTTQTEERRLTDVVANLMTENFVPKETLFNMKELTLLVEMHQDVVSTASENIVSAVDYVKHTVLAGQTYNPSKYNDVALGLKSFIASSSDEQRRELEQQRARATAIAEQHKEVASQERQLRIQRERTIEEQLAQISELEELRERQEEQITSMKQQLTAQGKELSRLGGLESTVRMAVRIGSVALTIAAFIVLVLVSSYAKHIAGYIQWKLRLDGFWEPILKCVRLFAAASFVLPSAFLIRNRDEWQLQGKSAVTAVCILIAIWVSQLVEKSTPIYSVAALSLLVATALIAVLTRNEREPSK